MRSRYTAYALSDVGYLLRSWHASTRPTRLVLDDDLTWTGLHVVATEAGGPFDDVGRVRFVARYTTPGGRGRLEEDSRFVREGGVWSYVDGVVVPRG